MKDDEFNKTMTSTDKDAWLNFKDVVEKCLENNRYLQFKTIVSTMLHNLKRLSYLMNMKIHSLKSHFD